MPRIKCDQYDYENDRWCQYEIDMELNLWPCCHFYTDKLSKGKVNESIEHIEINLRKNNINQHLLCWRSFGFTKNCNKSFMPNHDFTENP